MQLLPYNCIIRPKTDFQFIYLQNGIILTLHLTRSDQSKYWYYRYTNNVLSTLLFMNNMSKKYNKHIKRLNSYLIQRLELLVKPGNKKKKKNHKIQVYNKVYNKEKRGYINNIKTVLRSQSTQPRHKM